jgi:exonuclease SbcD
VELTLVSDTFLEAATLKRLHQAHDGIIHIIPVISNENENDQNIEKVNLNQDMQGLFADFFASKNAGITPDETILNLFKEIINEN